MIILSRKIGESFFINDDTEITILSRTHNEIKIGIELPPSYKVTKKEFYKQKKSNNN